MNHPLPPTLDERLEAWRSRASSDCPPSEAYAALAAGDLVGSWAARLEEHALECALCATERDLAREFLAEAGAGAADAEATAAIVLHLERTVAEPLLGSAVPEGRVVAFPGPMSRVALSRRATWRSWSVPLAAAAALALGIGVFWQSRSLPGLPDPGTGGPIRSTSVELQSPLGDVFLEPGQTPASAGLEFRWSSVADAVSYRVRLLDVTGVQLWQGESAQPRVGLPVAVGELLADRVRYRWEVTAVGAADAPVATSEPAEFRWLPEKEFP